ncbi:MAG: hypothetical protein ACE5EQ_04600 [Phycisphaerae bacterium]
MTRKTALVFALAGLFSGMIAGPVWSQAPDPKPAAQPTKPGGGLRYEVHQVQGKVRVSRIGIDPMDTAAWRYIQKGDLLGTGLQVSVPWRSSVKLVARPATPPTVLWIGRGSLVNIQELSIKRGVAKARLDLGYGIIRAGVAEGGVRSDMEITCPAATLSKRGTDIFEITYRNGQFAMRLSDQGRGLIQAIQLQYGRNGNYLGARSRFLTPGQAVTHRMAQAIMSMQLDREISINDLFGLKGTDQLMNLIHDRGIGIFFSQGGNLPDFLHPGTPGDGMNLPGMGVDHDTDGLGQTPVQTSQGRREGDFGIGQGGLPGIFEDDDKRRLDSKRNACRGGLQHEICRRLGLK